MVFLSSLVLFLFGNPFAVVKQLVLSVSGNILFLLGIIVLACFFSSFSLSRLCLFIFVRCYRVAHNSIYTYTNMTKKQYSTIVVLLITFRILSMSFDCFQ